MPPEGADHVWPHEAVRKVTDSIAIEELERGIELGVYNRRGWVCPKPHGRWRAGTRAGKAIRLLRFGRTSSLATNRGVASPDHVQI
jgi:hypothetical protein